ncbi:hypothetical protein Dimus_012966, partial [Dionaea muscipula]
LLVATALYNSSGPVPVKVSCFHTRRCCRSCGIVGRASGIELSFREVRCFDIEELSSATKNFGNQNLIGEGKFGEVYKGLLTDGMLVAIKKRPGAASQEFVDEALVVVHERKLEFKHRLSIALGAAKGLAHLHSLSPRLIQKDFKTSNVLVDEIFIPKVADAGIRNFLGRFDIAGPSSQLEADEVFLAPELKEFRRFSERSDANSFGVFLLELVSGQEARDFYSSTSDKTLAEWVSNHLEVDTLAGFSSCYSR